MSNVLPLRPVDDVAALVLVLRQYGFADPDELLEPENQHVWQMAADIAGIPEPTDAVKCAALVRIGLPVGVSSQSPERSCPPETRSSATAPEPVDRSWSSGRGAVTGSTSERRNA